MSSLITPRQAGSPSVSFEFFPPKSEAMADRLWETVECLEPMTPNFVVRCGRLLGRWGKAYCCPSR